MWTHLKHPLVNEAENNWSYLHLKAWGKHEWIVRYNGVMACWERYNNNRVLITKMHVSYYVTMWNSENDRMLLILDIVVINVIATIPNIRYMTLFKAKFCKCERLGEAAFVLVVHEELEHFRRDEELSFQLSILIGYGVWTFDEVLVEAVSISRLLPGQFLIPEEQWAHGAIKFSHCNNRNKPCVSHQVNYNNN